MRHVSSRIIAAPVLLFFGAGCGPLFGPGPAAPEVAVRYEPVWEGVLASIRDGSAPGEVDRSVVGLVSPSEMPPPGRLEFILSEERGGGLQPYRAPWVRSVVASGLVDTACAGFRECGGDNLTSLVELGDPVISGDSATVIVTDRTAIPSRCRPPVGGGTVGFHQRTVRLVREGERWRVAGSDLGVSGSGICGPLPPEMVEAQVRYDSLRRMAGPLAGTYRYVITLPEGDSLVVFSRTSRRVMSGIEERTLTELRERANSDRRGPVEYVGYYLDGDCAFTLEEIPGPPSRNVSCYHAFTSEPVLRTADSSVWRGESGAEVAAWILLDSVPLKPRLRNALDGDDDPDADWYFFPGYWIAEKGGRVRFRQDVIREGKVLLRIRGERVSRETTGKD
jgi:hypothetical protein